MIEYEIKNTKIKWTRIKRKSLYKNIRIHYLELIIICLLIFCIHWILKYRISKIFYDYIEPLKPSEDEMILEKYRAILNFGNNSHRYVINSARTDFVPPKDKLSRYRFDEKEFYYDAEFLEDKDLSALERNE